MIGREERCTLICSQWTSIRRSSWLRPERSSVPRFVRAVPQFARSQGYEERGLEDLDSSALHLDSSLLDLDLMEFEVTKSREEYRTSIHPHSASRREAMAAVDNRALVDAGIRRSCCSCIN